MRLNVSLKFALAELTATCLFVYIGTGTATTFGSLQTQKCVGRPACPGAFGTVGQARDGSCRRSVQRAWRITPPTLALCPVCATMSCAAP